MGGGQLGRMFVHAAQAMGYFVAVLDPDPSSPAGLAAQYHIQADYLDEQSLAQLMQRSAAITTEFENVPAAALATLGAHRPVAPVGRRGRDLPGPRRREGALRALRRALRTACGRSRPMNSSRGVGDAPAARHPEDGASRLRRQGPGRASPTVRELAAAWQALERRRCVLEKRVPLDAELSVIVARNADGDVVHLPVQQQCAPRRHPGA